MIIGTLSYINNVYRSCECGVTPSASADCNSVTSILIIIVPIHIIGLKLMYKALGCVAVYAACIAAVYTSCIIAVYAAYSAVVYAAYSAVVYAACCTAVHAVCIAAVLFHVILVTIEL